MEWNLECEFLTDIIYCKYIVNIRGKLYKTLNYDLTSQWVVNT